VKSVIRLALIAHHIQLSRHAVKPSSLTVRQQTSSSNFLGGNVRVSEKSLYRRKVGLGVKFAVMKWLQNPVAELNPASSVKWLQSMNTSRLVQEQFRSVVALSAVDF
jgi:hypothetical protein